MNKRDAVFLVIAIIVLVIVAMAGHFLTREQDLRLSPFDDDVDSAGDGSDAPSFEGPSLQRLSRSFYLVGNEELVFQYSAQRCEELDFPDIPARAFRDSQGVVNLISSMLTTRRMVGNSLNSISRDCAPVMTSTRNPQYSVYMYYEWLSSTYTLDGQIVYGLIHNEWYANLINSPNCISDPNCWVNSITAVASSDSGASFFHPTNYKVFAPPGEWNSSFHPNNATQTVYGYFEPSNIFKRGDYYYSMFKVEGRVPIFPANYIEGTCLMRTNNLTDASAWEVWTSSGWNTSETAICAIINYGIIEKMHESITYNTHLDKYILIGYKFHPERGVFFSLSSDLFSWTKPVKVFDDPGFQYGMPSLLDPEDTSMNFENTGQEPYIYFIRNNGGFDRDLLRQKIHLCRPNELCEPPQELQCYAINTNGALYKINPENATKEFISNTGLRYAGALEASRNGKLYAADYFTPALYEINPSSGTKRLIGNINNLIFEGGLAIAPDNTAYLVIGGRIVGGLLADPALLSLDLNTGTTNVIGRITGVNRDISGLTWRNDNMLIGLDSISNSLLIINPTDASVSTLTTLSPRIGSVGGITSTNGETGFFATTSAHQSGSDELYSLNLYTGEYNLVGGLGSRTGEPGISGLACTLSFR